LDLESGEITARGINGPPAEALAHLAKLPGPLVATYEAGPTGYGLARAAARAGIELRVCAPGAIPRKPADRIKTIAATPSGSPGCSPPAS